MLLKKFLKKILIFAIIQILTACSPNSYEDCILQNMPEAKTKAAAYNIRESCKLKFPKTITIRHKDGSEELVPESELIPINSVGLDFDHPEWLQDVQITGYPYKRMIEVTNTGMPFNKLTLGITRYETCPNEYKSYDYFVHCTSGYKTIYKNTTAKMQCNKDIRNLPHCIVKIKMN